MENTILSIIEPINKAKEIFNSLDVSETTRKDYCSRIGLFLSRLEKDKLNFNSYLDFKRYLESRADFTASTKNKYLATTKVFLKELNRRGIIPMDITQNIKLFSQLKKHKREGLNEEDIRAIIEKIKELPNTPIHTRLRAIFCLLAFQGFRQIEITRLNIEDLDLVNKKAFIQGKGNDDKEAVYLAPETIKALNIYIKTNKIGSGSLFRSLGNRKSERLNSMTIKREFKKLFNEIGINKTTHGFRHFYITTLLKKLDVRDVRKFSRHRNLEMLIVYDDEIDIQNKTAEVFHCFDGLNIT
ncbi:MAG: tyrosine-type recombinase/integrase [Candidatus Staskawiczbacteria bacterium]|nr:tyrosine-type recombinase/integrase [Candidatus Staskawiczbacteria bacterium]